MNFALVARASLRTARRACPGTCGRGRTASAAVACLFALAACGGDSGSQVSTAGDAATAGAGATAGTRVGVERPTSAAGTPLAGTPDASTAVGAVDGPDGTDKARSAPSDQLRATRVSPLMPEDFRIGPLQDTITGDVDARRAAAIVAGFLRELANGQVATDLVEESQSTGLQRSLAPLLADGNRPRFARIGRVRVDQETARANVRLFAAGRVEGEVYLDRTTAGWRIADFQVDLAALSLPYAPAAEDFFPASYRWLLVN
jgi:hypothetical protein